MSGIVARLMASPKSTGSLGETQGTPEVVCKEVPFRSFKPTGGGEQEIARRIAGTTTYTVEVYGDPKWKELEKCWFEILPLTDPPRKLQIISVSDRKLNGLDLQILCGENK